MRRISIATALAGTSLLATATAAVAQDDATGADTIAQDVQREEESTADPAAPIITVVGSRIPRIEQEGPAPVVTITADDILEQGYSDVPEILASLSQNNGDTQTAQDYGANTFTPGAQQVDLRGLGPNHTLVLVNGRRIANFPMPYGGNSNVADISSIPAGFIDSVEVLSGAASAIYGSDAISGVVNFKLSEEVTGTRIDARAGFTGRGGGESYKLSGSTGFQTDRFYTLIGAQFSHQEQLFGFERDIQDSGLDSPTSDLAYRNFLRTDSDGYYIDPGQAACDSLSFTNQDSTYYASREGYGFEYPSYDTTPGYFCGSQEAWGYGAITSGWDQFNLYSSSGYEVSDRLDIFLDAQFGYVERQVLNGFKTWYYQAPDGDESGLFYNPDYVDVTNSYWDDGLDYWQRIFTPEETGGFENSMIKARSYTFNITPGIKGTFDPGLGEEWNYEVYYNHAEYRSRLSWPEIVIDAANDFFLGQPVDDPDNASGYQRFNADPTRLFTALTPAEYASISADTVYEPKTWVNNFQATVSTGELFQLPAGPVGFAAVAEIGNSGYEINPDPRALEQYYVGIQDSDGAGKRDHWGAGAEVRVPVFDFFQLTGAGRYDRYKYADNDFGQFTYNLGAELRPTDTLLVRGAIGTGFRAPDLHYVYRGQGTVNSSGADYYACRVENDSPSYTDCIDDNWSRFVGRRGGNPDLLPETAQSLTAGIVWAPSSRWQFSVDYYRVELNEEVLNLSTDLLLRDEAACRLGTDFDGNTVDVGSPTCQDALARVTRYDSGPLEGDIRLIDVLPVNTAQQTTDGIDFSADGWFSLDDVWDLSLGGAFTYVLNHTLQQYPGDPVIDKFDVSQGYGVAKEKGKAWATLSTDRFKVTLTGLYTGELTNWNWDGRIPGTVWYNLSTQYWATDNIRLNFWINNLLDSDPPKDPTHASYPYYNSSWYNSVGREFYVSASLRF
ncbi:TonB-dependent receptor domain-containing protein [Alteriqipengyuania sp. 357]